MSGIGSGAAAARDRGGPPPRLVAVPGGGNGRPVPRPARTVVFLGVTDDPRGKGAEAVRCIRDAIDRRVQRLLVRMGVALPARPR